MIQPYKLKDSSQFYPRKEDLFINYKSSRGLEIIRLSVLENDSSPNSITDKQGKSIKNKCTIDSFILNIISVSTLLKFSSPIQSTCRLGKSMNNHSHILILDKTKEVASWNDRS